MLNEGSNRQLRTASSTAAVLVDEGPAGLELARRGAKQRKERKMRTTQVLGAVALSAILARPAAAQAIHSGTWHSVETKSSWSNGNFPKGFSLTIVLSFSKDTLTYHSVNDTLKDKGKLFMTDWEAPLDDSVAPVNGGGRFNQVRVRPLGPDQFQVLEQKDGDVVVGQFWTFSSDGKTLVRHGVGKSPEGRSNAFEEFFERVN
jgi:hypothetical protein